MAICRSDALIFAACLFNRMHAPSARAFTPNPAWKEKSESWRQAGSTRVLKSHEPWQNEVMRTKGVEATKGWIIIVHFSIYPTPRCRCHAGADTPKLGDRTLQISKVVRNVRHLISGSVTMIHWKCDAWKQIWWFNAVSALWKLVCFRVDTKLAESATGDWKTCE